jgi:hypothetical protein
MGLGLVLCTIEGLLEIVHQVLDIFKPELIEAASNTAIRMPTGTRSPRSALPRIRLPSVLLKSVKSIVKFTFTDKRPVSFWEALQPNEYGFWANVNPDVPHRR